MEKFRFLVAGFYCIRLSFNFSWHYNLFKLFLKMPAVKVQVHVNSQGGKGGGAVLPYKCDRGARRTFRGLHLWIGTAGLPYRLWR